MTEGTFGGKGEALSPIQRAAMYLGNQAVPIWGGGVTGDFLNAVVGVSMLASTEALWPKIKAVRTIEAYVQEKIANERRVDTSEMAAAVIEQINPEFLTKANGIINEMNSIIGAGVTSQEQADALLAKFESFSALLYKREG